MNTVVHLKSVSISPLPPGGEGFRSAFLVLGILLAFLTTAGCSQSPPDDEAKRNAAPASEAAPTNRIDIPATVRRNLGITFAEVERRSVARTIRVPGRFELLPEGRREYRTMLAGRVEVLVRQYDRVEEGAPLFKLASPEWRELQNKLTDAESTIRQTEARVGSIPTLIAAHHGHEEILKESIALWEKRVEQLEQSERSGAVSANEVTIAQNTLSTQRAELAEILEREADLEGQIATAQAEHDAAHARFRLLLATASTLLGVGEAELAAPYNLDEHLNSGVHRHEEPKTRPVARWREINEVLVCASVPGVVASLELTNGAWATTGTLVLTTMEPTLVRFRARGLQSDLTRLRQGLPARIVPPKGGSVDLQDTMEGTLALGLGGDPDGRTVELLVTPKRLSAWARPGMSAHLEITVEGGTTEELAIPLSAVIRDGLQTIFFRRDPKDPDKAIRLEADLGINDGRWVVVESGVKEGDEVVLDGVYQLMLATSGSASKGGHFHADGTFHEGGEKE